MSEKAKVTPKDFFLWLGAMVALYVSVGSFVALLFEYIDRLFGPGFIGYDPYTGAMSFAIASLIVLFPLYIYLTRILNQDMRKHPEKKELWVRRWLVFLTVFGAGAAMVIDVVVLLYTFLSGSEITAAFILKVLTVLVIFGAIFYYYVEMIRGTWDRNEKRSRIIGIVVALIVFASIVGGFFIMGSPQTQRELRDDRQRVSDLQNLEFRIQDYYRDKQELPETLEDITSDNKGAFLPRDPQTRESYEYTRVDALTFELCAVFNQQLPQIADDQRAYIDEWRYRELERQAADWNHGEGRTCFEREIDPDRLKPFEVLR